MRFAQPLPAITSLLSSRCHNTPCNTAAPQACRKSRNAQHAALHMQHDCVYPWARARTRTASHCSAASMRMALTARRARRPPARRPPPPRKRAPLPCPPPSRAQEMPLPAATRSTSRRERGLCARQPPTRPSPSPHRQASTVWWLVQAAAGPAARCVACRQIHGVVFSTARDLHSVPAQRSLS